MEDKPVNVTPSEAGVSCPAERRVSREWEPNSGSHSRGFFTPFSRSHRPDVLRENDRFGILIQTPGKI